MRSSTTKDAGLDGGASRDDIAEVMSVAMFILAVSQLNWTNAYNHIFTNDDDMG